MPLLSSISIHSTLSEDRSCSGQCAGSPVNVASSKGVTEATTTQALASSETCFLVSLRFHGEGASLAVELEPNAESVLVAVSDAFEVCTSRPFELQQYLHRMYT